MKLLHASTNITYPLSQPLRFAADETKKPANKPSPRPEDYDPNNPETPLWAVVSPCTKWGKERLTSRQTYFIAPEQKHR